MTERNFPTYQETKTGADVLRWLQDNGYQIEKSKFYEDVSFGRLKKNKKGVFTSRLVKRYAATLPLAETGMTEDDEKSDLYQQKLQEDLRKVKLQNEKLLIEIDVERGKYIPRDDFHRELAGRLAVLYSGLEQMVRGNAVRLVHIVGGEQHKKEHLIDAMLQEVNRLVHSYASAKKYHVVVVDGQDDDQHKRLQGSFGNPT